MPTWNAAQPANNTPLRELGVVTRPNFEAIQQGDNTLAIQAINLVNRDSLALPVPTALANTFKLYCDIDTVNNVMPFGVAPGGKYYQLGLVQSGFDTIGATGWIPIFDFSLASLRPCYGFFRVYKAQAGSTTRVFATFTWDGATLLRIEQIGFAGGSIDSSTVTSGIRQTGTTVEINSTNAALGTINFFFDSVPGTG